MNKYHVFVDESYDLAVFVLAIVWVSSINEIKRIKSDALKKLGKSKYSFHFIDDPPTIRNTFLGEILNSALNMEVLLSSRQPKSCMEYAKFYVTEVVRVLPIKNSLLFLHVKGLKNWVSKRCDILAEAVKLGIENGNYVKLDLRASEREGIEIADYAASSFRKCLYEREDYCSALERKLKFISYIS
ncbi:MAG: hypothetical protein RXQ75_07190 [Acidianus hospitalis]